MKAVRWLCVIMVLSACGKTTGNKGNAVVHFNGNPIAFVAGADLDFESGIPASLLESSGSWRMTFKTFSPEPDPDASYVRQSVLDQNTQPNMDKILELNRAPNWMDVERMRAKGHPEYNFEEATGLLRTEVHDKRINFRFHKRGDNYHLIRTHPSDSDETFHPNFRMLHYSVKNNGKAFSVLFEVAVTSDLKTGLFAAYFYRAENTSPLQQVAGHLYKYLLGPGIKVIWPEEEDLTMQVCDTGYEGVAELSKLGIREWQAALGNSRELKSEIKTSCPPFSDLNTKTIFHVKDWQLVDDHGFTHAMTYNPANIYDSVFLDSDIWVIEDEWQESMSTTPQKMADPNFHKNYYFRLQYKRMITHEMGHFLGLHHEFERRSVMSYNNVLTVQSHDVGAVRNLYPQQRHHRD